MYQKIIVPLDGSDLAEVALPHVVEIARGCSVPNIILVSVTEQIKGKVAYQAIAGEFTAREYHTSPANTSIPAGSYHTGYFFSPDSREYKEYPAEIGKMAQSAWNYLSKIAVELGKSGLSPEISVIIGSPAVEIIRFAESEKADLIIMGSRGRSGFNRWDMGNIAEKVIRAVNIPVLLVKPQPGFKETKSRRRGLS